MQNQNRGIIDTNREMPQEATICISNNNGKFHYRIVSSSDSNTSPFDRILKKIADKEDDLSSNKESYIRIRIVIHTPASFLTFNAQKRDDVNSFAQGNLECVSGGDKIEDWDAIPCIHVTKTDMFVESLYGCESLDERIPRSFQITDNSIWNYLIPQCNGLPDISKNGEKDSLSFENNLRKAVESISRNYENGLYSLNVAKEYADLNARLAKEAFVAGPHAEGVSPFIFHSESSILRMINKEFVGEDDVLERICGRKWRFLLVDDKAIVGMGSKPSPKEIKYQWNCKLYIIINLLNNFFQDYATKSSNNCKVVCKEYTTEGNVIYRQVNESRKELEEIKEDALDDSIIVMFEYAQSVKEAERLLAKRMYDIVLLDYYLDKEGNHHSYGTDLLENIYTYISSNKRVKRIQNNQDEAKKIFDEQDVKYEELRKYCKSHEDLNFLFEQKSNDLVSTVAKKLRAEKKLGIGPCGRHYFMFISAYSSAVHDRLLAEGLNQSEKYWYITLGACPTNTPQLFLYNLIKLMDKRLDDANIDDLSVEKIIGILENIYGAESVRKGAGEYYEKIQSCQYFYRNLLQDYDGSVGDNNIFEAKKSVLITDFLNHHINMGGLVEHLAQLVHLTAFGTVRQWPEMWEEYLYSKAQIGAQITNNDLEMRFNQVCNKIQGYILKLKSSAL